MATKTRRIVITLPERILNDVDWLAPLEEMTRDELIGEAVKRLLKPHLEIRALVLKAAAKPGKTHGPFNTADEMIADMKGRLKQRAAPKKAGSPQSGSSLAETAEEKLIRLRQLEALKASAGAWKDKDHPELKQGAAKWVRKLRRQDERRFKKVTAR